MPVQEFAITALADIPPLVATFAAANGWAVSGTSTQPVLRRADDSSALSFRLVAAGAGTSQRLTWDGSSNGAVAVTSRAAISVPAIKSGSSAVVPAVSRLTLMAGTGPYLAIVVAFAGGFYRHLYLGNTIKAGTYTGGEIIGGSSLQSVPSGTGAIACDDPRWAHLFSAQSDAHRDFCGGIRIGSGSNPTSWREFRRNAVAWNAAEFDQTMALGGWLDAINSGSVARGSSSYAGRSIMTPINIYITMAGKNLAPVGHVAGIRMIDIRDIDPGTIFALGTETWRVFPAFRKSASPDTAYEDGVAVSESSYRLGYAYRTA